MFAVAVVIYFWWQNIKGIHESSERALQIMKITTVMVVMLIVWCLITLAKHGGQLPPLPSPADMHHNKESSGLAAGDLGGADSPDHAAGRFRALRAGHER